MLKLFYLGRRLQRSAADRGSLALGIVILLIVASFISVPRIKNADAVVADLGFSPLDYTITSTKLDADNFPDGTEAYNVSLPMRAARGLDVVFGISSTFAQRVIYAVEPIAVMITGWLLARTLIPNAPTGFYLIFVLLFSGSHLRDSNFGTWPSPFYNGLYYVLSEAAGTVGLILLLRRRYIGAATCVAAAVLGHAIIGACFAAAGVAIMLLRPREILLARTLSACVLFIAISCLWLVSTMDWSVPSERIGNAEWIRMVWWGGYHTYPIQAGLFDSRHTTHFTGFCAFVLLFATYLTVHWERLPFRGEVIAASIAAMLLVLLALWVSYAQTGVVIEKLHLHRANMILLLLGSPIVVFGLWTDIGSGRPVRTAIALFALATPFYFSHGIVLAPAIALCASHIVDNFDNPAMRRRLLAPSVLLATVVLIYAYYLHTGLPPGFTYFVLARQSVTIAVGTVLLLVCISMLWWRAPRDYFVVAVLLGFLVIAAHFQTNGSHAYLGITRDNFVLAGISAAMLAVLFLRFYQLSRASFTIAMMLVLGCLAVKLQIESFAWRDRQLDYANDYLKVQLWAKNNTPPGTLFAPDPTHSYGWRALSERPSWGSLREWLYVSALYSGGRQWLDEGRRRYAALGLNIDDDLGLDEPLAGYYRSLERVTALYCNLEAERFADIGRRFGVHYFVFEKANCKKPPNVQLAFESKYFYVGRPIQ